MTRNRCRGWHVGDIQAGASPTRFGPFHQYAIQWHSLQSVAFAHLAPTITNIAVAYCRRMTITHHIQALAVVFLSSDLYRLLHSSIFGIYISLQPLLADAAHSTNGGQRQPLQQQFVNQRLGFFRNRLPRRIFNELASARFASELGFSIVDMPITHYQT